MNLFFAYLAIWLSMLCFGIVEASVEGKNIWDKRKYGWKTKIGDFILTRYHFYLFFITFPLLVIVLPLIFLGYTTKMFLILLSAYISGMVVEDFSWYLYHTELRFRESFNSSFGHHYKWVNLGIIEIPLPYFIGITLSIMLCVIATSF